MKDLFLGLFFLFLAGLINAGPAINYLDLLDEGGLERNFNIPNELEQQRAEHEHVRGVDSLEDSGDYAVKFFGSNAIIKKAVIAESKRERAMPPTFLFRKYSSGARFGRK